MIRRLVRVWLLAILVAAPTARAAGPLLVLGNGEPLTWGPAPIPWNPDQGPLGILANPAAVANVAANFAVWEAVPTATVSFVNAGPLPQDVQPGNVSAWLGLCNDLSPIIFDDDGQVTDLLLGAGASSFVLGFAGPECAFIDDEVPPNVTIIEGYAVLNGRFIDGDPDPEIPLAEFNGVFVHEFGHYLGLDHSQVSLAEAFDDDPGNDEAVATMFPFLGTADFSTLHLDDRVSLSMLYPAPSLATGFGAITGHYVLRDGTTPFQGAYVVARQIGDPRITAAGMATGARFFPGASFGPPPPELEGFYELPGLPPGDYTIEVEAIDPSFTGGSSVGPRDPPTPLPGPAEFWNGADEAGSDPPDDPTVATPITVTAGSVATDVDVVANEAANDDCSRPVVIPPVALHFRQTALGVQYSSAPSDPIQSCTVGGPSQNEHSIWYAFTPPVDGILHVRTGGRLTDFDTVLTIYTGTCGALTEIACSDREGTPDRPREAFANVDVAEGVTYLIEVTTHVGTPPGVLDLNSDFEPASLCDDPGSMDRPRLTLKNLTAPAGDEKLTFIGFLGLPSATVLDPVADGAQIRIEDLGTGYTSLYELSPLTVPPSIVPPGGLGTGCGPLDGWTANAKRTGFKYRNSTNAFPPCVPGSAKGLTGITVSDRRAKTGRIKVKINVSGATIPSPGQIGENTTGLRVAVALSGAPGAPCAERQFSLNTCGRDRAGRQLACH